MGVLSDRARAGVTKLNKRPDLPDWWPAMQVVGAIVVVVVLAVGVISGKGSLTGKQTPAGYISISTANNGKSPTPSTSSGSSQSVSIPLVSDPTSTASVPSGSLAMAKIAATALFTGNQSGLLLAAKSSFTPPSSPTTTVNVLSISLVSQSSAKITFAVSVDLSDGVGPRTFALTVTLEKDAWVFLPSA